MTLESRLAVIPVSADAAGVDDVVMLLMTQTLKVA